MESHKVDMKQKICIAYVPMILKGMTEISAALGVSQKTVKEWVEYGAPISIAVSYTHLTLPTIA